jgi:hypothetical protein
MNTIREYVIVRKDSGEVLCKPFSFDNVSQPRVFADYAHLEVGDTSPACMVNGHGGSWEAPETTPHLLKRVK